MAGITANRIFSGIDAEIIRNPLLATTLCVLAKNEIELPNTEITLYDERLKLLTGYYDRAGPLATNTK